MDQHTLMGPRAHHTKAIATLSRCSARFCKVMNRNNILKNVCALEAAQRMCLGKSHSAAAAGSFVPLSKGVRVFVYELCNFKQEEQH